MTARRDLKGIIRERQQTTGESYTTARVDAVVQLLISDGIDTQCFKTTFPEPPVFERRLQTS